MCCYIISWASYMLDVKPIAIIQQGSSLALLWILNTPSSPKLPNYYSRSWNVTCIPESPSSQVSCVQTIDLLQTAHWAVNMSINRVKLSDAFPQEAQGPHAQVQSSVWKAMWNRGFSKRRGSVAYPLANSNVACVCMKNSTDQFLPLSPNTAVYPLTCFCYFRQWYLNC